MTRGGIGPPEGGPHVRRVGLYVRIVTMACALLCAAAVSEARAQQLVTVSVPASVSFNVVNVAATTTGTPAPTTVTVINPTFFANSDKLRVSVRADSTSFSAPSGSATIPASAVSWTTSASGGSGANGTLSPTAFVEVFRSGGNFKAANASVTWRLGPVPAAGLRAGTHTLSIRWKFEVF